MLMPSIFGESLFDDFMDFSVPRMYKEFFSNNVNNAMRTDVKETDQGYELDIDLPGFKKEDIQLELKDGYLSINAQKSSDNDQKDQDGKYIRRERYYGAMSRSFYVGENAEENDIHARFEDGILKLSVPKEQPKRVENKKYISIEG